jgi:hypothetical protein
MLIILILLKKQSEVRKRLQYKSVICYVSFIYDG